MNINLLPFPFAFHPDIAMRSRAMSWQEKLFLCRLPRILYVSPPGRSGQTPCRGFHGHTLSVSLTINSNNMGPDHPDGYTLVNSIHLLGVNLNALEKQVCGNLLYLIGSNHVEFLPGK
jgi:hypothetical protein